MGRRSQRQAVLESHTRCMSITVHDTFPFLPPPKKKKNSHCNILGNVATVETLIMHKVIMHNSHNALRGSVGGGHVWTLR